MSLSDIYEANGPFFTVVFLLLSVSTMGLIVYRILANHFAKTNVPDYLERLEATLEERGNEAALTLSYVEPGLIPKVFIAVLESPSRSKMAARNAILTTVEQEILPSLNASLAYLLLSAKVSPMIGLLGTVSGMIAAFQKIAGATKVDPSTLANSIGMALFTTWEGLVIAIIAIFFYTVFQQHVHRYEIELQRAADAALKLLPKMQ